MTQTKFDHTVTTATALLRQWEAATERREAAYRLWREAKANAKRIGTQAAHGAALLARQAYHDADDDVIELTDTLTGDGWQIIRPLRLTDEVVGILRATGYRPT